ncbi:MAG: hypothetical protein KF773_02765 [Deltaproteobacteria bacterium]|nr:hypothetical protein [Deltaproteobacteria bacterium]
MEFANAFRASLGRDEEGLEAALAPVASASVEFAPHLAALVGEAPVVATLAALEVADLYLAFRCARGEAEALAELDRGYLPGLRAPLGRLGLDGAAIDETLQRVRAELLAPRPKGPPRILSYSGRGRIAAWLRAVAIRAGLRLVREPRGEELDEATRAGVGDDAELAYMKRTYGDAFRRAFRVALAELPARDRLLLKQRFRHDLGVVELGTLHNVHAGTISRWVAAAREALARKTREVMMRELRVDGDVLASILRLVESQLDVSLSALDA